MKTLLIIALSLCTFVGQARSEEADKATRHVLSPSFKGGVELNVDANGLHAGRYSEKEVPDKPAFSVGFIAKASVGDVSDILNLSIGIGYRGLFDQAPPHEFIYHPSYSDYLFYTKEEHRHGGSEVRPLGGLLVFPAEIHLNLIPSGGDGSFFIGMGVEYGMRLYQPKRYQNYFGAHIMNSHSLSYTPMIGVNIDSDDGDITLAIYYRRYPKNCFNTADVPIEKFSPNYLGFKVSFVF